MKIVPVRKFLCVGVVALAFVASAFAQPAAPALPPSFAVLSLVGDQFTVVFRRDESGTRLDPNSRREYPVATAAFDDMAMGAAEDVIKRLKPVSPVLRFSIRDPRLFALQDKLLVDADDSRGLREALAKLARDNAVTRLVLVTKRRDDANFPIVTGKIGSGKISGLGFFVDSFTRIRRTQTGEATTGFLGPYAYLSVTIVDVATMSAIRSVPAGESDMELPLNATGAVRAWDALTPEGKVEALERVLRRAVASATSAALAD
jgi:hypothetical protein